MQCGGAPVGEGRQEDGEGGCGGVGGGCGVRGGGQKPPGGEGGNEDQRASVRAEHERVQGVLLINGG
mgnify:CR=1 FL=1